MKDFVEFMRSDVRDIDPIVVCIMSISALLTGFIIGQELSKLF